MNQFQVQAGRPIYNMQEFLRVIAMFDSDIPVLIPDGIFGTQTETVVRIFQKKYDLPETGEVDNNTWDMIIEVYEKVKVYMIPPSSTQMFPESTYIIREGDSGDFMYPIQAMMYVISKKFSNIPECQITGTHTHNNCEATKKIQECFGKKNCNGEIDVYCWQLISRLYENLISKDIFNSGRPGGTAGQDMMPQPSADLENTTVQAESLPQKGTGLAFAPKLDIYESGNPRNSDEVPLPQQGGADREPVVNPSASESAVLRRPENAEGQTQCPECNEDANRYLSSTDMSGKAVVRNPNPEFVSAPRAEDENGREASLQNAPVTTEQTLYEEESRETEAAGTQHQDSPKKGPIRWNFF